MLNFQNILKNRKRYNIAKIWVDWWHNNYFYRKVTIVGEENIPKDKPVLIGPNHQNALMDALAVLCLRKDKPVFLTRSDIFQPEFMGKIFVFLRMLPVYRIRDGKEKLAQNEEIFNVSVSVLENNKTLVVFPEAQHTPYRSILILKKGLMRIAFSAAEKTNFELDINIIPAGIYYSNYYKYRAQLLVQYGEPIKINDYKELYLENQQSALLKLKKDMREKMIPYAIHIKNKEFYNQFEDARALYDNYVSTELNLDLKKPLEKFKTDKKIIDILDKTYDNEQEKFNEFITKQKNYTDKLKENKLKDYLFDKPWSKLKILVMTFLGVIFSPIYFLALINFFVPLIIPEKLVKSFKDPQFHSSVRFIASLFLIPIWYIIGFIVIAIFVKIWWIKFIFIIVQGGLFVFWLDFMRLYRKTVGHWRFWLKKKTRKILEEKRTELVTQFHILFKKYNQQ